MESKDYNPDVLNCIANLSNDEVFTPPQLVNEMLDLLPQELFSNPQARFLDPFTKSGVFLREIVKRLDVGLSGIIPDRQERILHIMHNQIFGIALTELTSLLARRTVYCSKYANSEHSIGRFKIKEGYILYTPMQHSWHNGRCMYCGASKEVFDRGDAAETYAYNFIHTNNPEKFFPNMTFDVIIGNPPYQLEDGGQAASSKPLYNLFVEQAKRLSPKYLLMIIPARWYAGGKGLDEFRNKMLNDGHISTLVDYSNSADCFPGVNIAGGVCYFLWDKDLNTERCCVINASNDGLYSRVLRPLNEFPVLVRSNTAISIIHKALKDNTDTMKESVLSYSYFAIRSYERGKDTKQENDVILLSSNGKGYYPKQLIEDKLSILNKYKVIITYAMSGGNKPTSAGNYQVISSLQILKPNEVCTETYLILGVFDDDKKASNLCSYVNTSFFRFLLLQALTSIHITKNSFLFVPLQDFSEKWTDEKLYKKYRLDAHEIDFIESMIKPME